MKIEKLVPDTSVIIEGILSKLIQSGELELEEAIIHEAIVAELEHQANDNKAIGFLGIDELDRIRDLSKNKFELRFAGKRPSSAEIRYARLGEIDSLIRELAHDEGGTLFTSDKVQARVAKAKGIKCVLQEITDSKKKIKLEAYFDKNTMSVHLRDNVRPYAKKGQPGDWKFIPVGENPLTAEPVIWARIST